MNKKDKDKDDGKIPQIHYDNCKNCEKQDDKSKCDIKKCKWTEP